MQIINETKIDFAGKRKIALAISGFILIVGIVSIIIRGFAANIDFTGGTEMQYRFASPVTETQLRDAFSGSGIEVEVTTLHAPHTDQPDWMIKIQGASDVDEKEAIEGVLSAAFPSNSNTLLAMHKIGPRVGEELKWDAMWSIIWAMVFIVIYITVRFEFVYAIGALIALVHDVTMTLGIFSLLQIEISLPIIAALLTIVGYSLNDTIVVYDRIRENVKKVKGHQFIDVINISINQTLSRTLLTSLTTLFVVMVLFFFGGATLHNMSFALIMGILIGTYSSIFVASPVLIEWHARMALKAANKQ
jgi:preprotein translocase SecF subunit